MRVSIRPRARADIEEIGRFTEERWGRDQRRRYLDEPDRRIMWVAAHPMLGRPRDAIAPGLLSARAGSHVIYYRATADTLVIVRVLHGRADPARAFRS